MELWDVYDKNRKKVGRTHQRGIPMKKGDYHLVVHIWIINSKGEYLIQKRAPWKEGWPNAWDCSAAGSAISGDDSDQTAKREVMEEIGLDMDMGKAERLFTIKSNSVFDDVYLLRQNVELDELRLQYEEVADVKWATEKEIKEMVSKGEFIPYPSLDHIFELSKSPVALVKATAGDAEVLYQMQKDVFMPIYEKYQDHDTSPVNQPKGRFLRRFEVGDYFKINYKGELAGSVFVFERELGVMKLHVINILDKFQNLGIAQETMARIELLYPQAKKWELETIEAEERNCYLYEKMGYKGYGEPEVINHFLTIVKYEKEQIKRVKGM